MKNFISKIKRWARNFKQQIIALHYAFYDKRTPQLAKIMIFLIIAYALSPLDLIPDFIPVLGYLDDLILLPLAIALTLKLIPERVYKDAQEKAEKKGWDKKKSLTGLIIVISIWLLIAFFLGLKFYKT